MRVLLAAIAICLLQYVSAACELGSYAAHESDCSKFKQCNHGSWVIKDCPAPLQWDQSIMTCNWASAVNCVAGVAPTPDACSTSPCVNGLCYLSTTSASGYSCICNSGYNGDRCEYSVNVDICAQSNPCLNNGICSNTNTGYLCNCQPGYTGVNCQTYQPPTVHCATGISGTECLNGGACVWNGQFSCSCLTPYTGARCEINSGTTNTNACSNSPCKNGGVCRLGSTSGSYTCDCPVSYIGDTCENYRLAPCPGLLIDPNVDKLVKRIDEGIELKCSAGDSTECESADLQWFDASGTQVTAKTGRIKISGYGNRLSLMITRLENGDEGSYSCKATNNGYLIEKSIVIEIYKGIAIIESPTLQRPNINTDAFIICNVDATAASIEWMYGDGRPIDFSTGRYIQTRDGLVIKNITEKDNGVYFCAVNVPSMGDFYQYPITIHVTIPPKSIGRPIFSPAVFGKKFAMICYATGDPKPVFTFYKDDELLVGSRYLIDPSNGRLEIETMEATDSGLYKCVAINLQDGIRGVKTGGVIEELVNVNVQ